MKRSVLIDFLIILLVTVIQFINRDVEAIAVKRSILASDWSGVSGVRSRERERGPCGTYPEGINNGWVSIRSRGRVARFQCAKGYELIGSRISSCVNRKWNNPKPICVTRGCKKLFLPPPVKITELFRQSVLEFACELGYELSVTKNVLEPTNNYRLYCDGSQWIPPNVKSYNYQLVLPSCKIGDPSPALSCDFEHNSCGWLQDHDDEFDWQRNQFSTPSGSVNTGPSFDHTLGSAKAGYYMFIETSSPRKPNDTARLFSPVYEPQHSNSCFVFWYHMFGKTTGYMKIYIKKEPQLFAELEPVWNVFGDMGDNWLRGTVPIPHLTEPFQIVLEGVRGSSYVGDTAIDDIGIKPSEECYTANNTDIEHWLVIPTPQSQVAFQPEFSDSNDTLDDSFGTTLTSIMDDESESLVSSMNISLTTIKTISLNSTSNDNSETTTVKRQPNTSTNKLLPLETSSTTTSTKLTTIKPITEQRRVISDIIDNSTAVPDSGRTTNASNVSQTVTDSSKKQQQSGHELSTVSTRAYSMLENITQTTSAMTQTQVRGDRTTTITTVNPTTRTITTTVALPTTAKTNPINKTTTTTTTTTTTIATTVKPIPLTTHLDNSTRFSYYLITTIKPNTTLYTSEARSQTLTPNISETSLKPTSITESTVNPLLNKSIIYNSSNLNPPTNSSIRQQRRKNNLTKTTNASPLESSSSFTASDDKSMGTAVIIVSIFIAVITLSLVSFYVIRNRKFIFRSRNGEDSEMIYLSSSEMN